MAADATVWGRKMNIETIHGTKSVNTVTAYNPPKQIFILSNYMTNIEQNAKDDCFGEFIYPYP